MRWFGKPRLRFLKGQRGISFVETLVAVAILGAIGVTFMSAMYTAHRNVGIMDEQQQAETLARSQLEQIKDAPYLESGEYPVTVDLPSQYSMTITVTAPMHIGTLENNTPLEELVEDVSAIQEITVFIYHGNTPVLLVACYKLK